MISKGQVSRCVKAAEVLYHREDKCSKRGADLGDRERDPFVMRVTAAEGYAHGYAHGPGHAHVP